MQTLCLLTQPPNNNSVEVVFCIYKGVIFFKQTLAQNVGTFTGVVLIYLLSNWWCYQKPLCADTALDDNAHCSCYWGCISWSCPCRIWRIPKENRVSVLEIRRCVCRRTGWGALSQVRLRALPLSLLIFQIWRVIEAATWLTGWGQSDIITVKVLENVKALCKYN